METTVLQRIREFIEFTNISDRKFAETIGVPQTTISSLFKRGNEPNISIISAILKAYPIINMEWLISGNGNMLKMNMVEDENQIVDSDIWSRFEEFITNQYPNYTKSLDKASAELNISAKRLDNILYEGAFLNYSEIVTLSDSPLNIEWLLTGNGEMLKSEKYNILAEPSVEYGKNQTRPRVPLTAAAGSLSGESIGVTLQQCEQMPLIHQIPSYDFTMFIKGDSMSPRFESGDEIACRHIDQSRFIQWGKVHVLDTTQGFVIKRVYEDGDKIRCVSYNPEYSDFSVPKEDILSMSLVVGVVSIMEM